MKSCTLAIRDSSVSLVTTLLVGGSSATIRDFCLHDVYNDSECEGPALHSGHFTPRYGFRSSSAVCIADCSIVLRLPADRLIAIRRFIQAAALSLCWLSYSDFCRVVFRGIIWSAMAVRLRLWLLVWLRRWAFALAQRIRVNTSLINVPKLRLRRCYVLIHLVFIYLGRIYFVFVYLISVCLALIGGTSYALRQGNGRCDTSCHILLFYREGIYYIFT